MTRTVYSPTTLTAMTVTQLKSIASQLGAIPDGDRRVKQTWVNAILDRQVMFSPKVVEPVERAKEAELLIKLAIADDVAIDGGMGITITTPSITELVERAEGADVFAEHHAIDRETDRPISYPSTHQPEGVTLDTLSEGHVINLPLVCNKSEASIRQDSAAIVLIALATILYAVCLAPIGLGIAVYRAIRSGSRSRVGHLNPPFGNPRQTTIDYFPFPT